MVFDDKAEERSNLLGYSSKYSLLQRQKLHSLPGSFCRNENAWSGAEGRKIWFPPAKRQGGTCGKDFKVMMVMLSAEPSRQQVKVLRRQRCAVKGDHLIAVSSWLLGDTFSPCFPYGCMGTWLSKWQSWGERGRAALANVPIVNWGVLGHAVQKDSSAYFFRPFLFVPGHLPACILHACP